MSEEDDDDCPVTRRECSLIRKTILEKINSLRKEMVIAVTVSTTWITVFLLILNYIHKL